MQQQLKSNSIDIHTYVYVYKILSWARVAQKIAERESSKNTQKTKAKKKKGKRISCGAEKKSENS